jgi:hypothetical protein
MSIINAYISPTEAIVGVDTLAAAQDGRRVHTSKVFPIAHLNAVIAWRGQSVFHDCLLMHCHMLNAQTLDDLIDWMPEMLGRVEQLTAQHVLSDDQAFKGGTIVDGNELVLVGWSQKRARMLGWCFRKVGDMEQWQDGEIQYCHAPRCDDGIPNKPAAMEKYAKAQVRKMAGMAGGTLIVCRVTRAGMTLRHTMKFPDDEPAPETVWQ